MLSAQYSIVAVSVFCVRVVLEMLGSRNELGHGEVFHLHPFKKLLKGELAEIRICCARNSSTQCMHALRGDAALQMFTNDGLL